jgi:hypothetical protein
MKKITYTNIPDEGMEHILNGFCQTFGYQEVVADPQNPGLTIPNPQSREAFTLERIMDYILQVSAANAVRVAVANTQTQYQALAVQTVEALRAPVVAAIEDEE